MNNRIRTLRDTDSAALDLVRHERKCSVCQHPDREAIEEAFLHWHKVANITAEFELPGSTAVYRHAHAFGLFQRRSRNFRFALEHIIEGAQWTSPSANEVIHAIRAHSRLNEDGKWIDPPTTHMVMVAAPAAASTLPAGGRPNLSGQMALEEGKSEEKTNKVIATPVAAENQPSD
jgi:hypothetical protein